MNKFEFDDRKSINSMTTSRFLDEIHNLYIAKITLSHDNFEQKLKHFFRDILDKQP